MPEPSGYERLKNIDHYRTRVRQATEQIQNPDPALIEGQEVALKKADEVERSTLSELMYTNRLLPDPSYARNFSLREQCGDTENRDDWIEKERESLTQLIGHFHIKDNHLSKSARQRADYVSERILHHFG